MNTKPRSCRKLPPASARAGFSLLELVVVLFIAAVGITLLLVFIQKMRERGHRVHCQNNLREIGKAVNLYRKEDLPPSRIADGYATWAVLIVPFLAKNSPLDRWDLERPYFEQPEAER